MTTPSASAIARGLTEAQKRYLTMHAEFRSPDGFSEKRWMTFPPSGTHRALMLLGLVDGCGQIRSLGLAVRDILQGEGL